MKEEYTKKKEFLFKLVTSSFPYIDAYLHSKEIYSHLVVYIVEQDKWIIAKVKSKSSDETYDVFIDLINDVYTCSCPVWTFKHYEIPIPEEYKPYFKKDTIAICPHILKVLEVYFASLRS